MAAEEQTHYTSSEAGILSNEASEAPEDTNSNPLLRYLQGKGRVADAGIDSDGETAGESRGASLAATPDGVPPQPTSSAASEREALLKYMSRRGITLEAPVALAEFILEDEYLDEKTPVIKGRIEKELSAEYMVDTDGRTTAENLIEAADELNEAARPLKYALGEEAGSSLRENICADVKRYLRDKRPGIRLVARSAQRFLKFDEQMRQEEHAKAQRIIKEKHELKKRQEEIRRAHQGIAIHADEGSESGVRNRADGAAQSGLGDIAAVDQTDGGAVGSAINSPAGTSYPSDAENKSSAQNNYQVEDDPDLLGARGFVSVGAGEKHTNSADEESSPESNISGRRKDYRFVKLDNLDASPPSENNVSKHRSSSRSLGSLETKLISNGSQNVLTLDNNGDSSGVNATGNADEVDGAGIISSTPMASKSRTASVDNKETMADIDNDDEPALLESPKCFPNKNVTSGEGRDLSHASVDGDAGSDNHYDGDGDGSSSGKCGSFADLDDDDDVSRNNFEQFRGYSLLESKLGGTYLGINLKADKSKQFTLVSMHLEDDGVPYESMLWNLKPDGSLESKVDGLVLQVTDDGESTAICGQRKCDRNGSLKASCKWTYTSKGELVNEASEYLLTIRNGSRENFTEVWCNYRLPKVGKIGGATKAQRWIFSAFNEEAKPASSAPEILSEPSTSQAVKHHLKFLLGI